MSRTVRIEGPLTASLCAIHDMVLFYSYLYIPRHRTEDHSFDPPRS